jgi:hypothetical protein
LIAFSRGHCGADAGRSEFVDANLLMQEIRNRAKHGTANKRSPVMVGFSMKFFHQSFMIEANDI